MPLDFFSALASLFLFYFLLPFCVLFLVRLRRTELNTLVKMVTNITMAAARIHQPALLLWCQQDAVIDASAMSLFGVQMPQATQVLLDGCGHMSIMERPDDVAAAVDLLIRKGEPR